METANLHTKQIELLNTNISGADPLFEKEARELQPLNPLALVQEEQKDLEVPEPE
jgi:hypothetical protein